MINSRQHITLNIGVKSTNKISSAIPLTIALIKGKLFYYQKETVRNTAKITISESTDAKKFSKQDKNLLISNIKKKSVLISQLSYLHIVPKDKGFAGIFGFGKQYYSARSQDGLIWDLQEQIRKSFTSAAIVTSHMYQNKHILYWADRSIHIGFSEDLVSWTFYDDPIFEPKLRGNQSIKILNSFVGKEEIFVVYSIETNLSDSTYFSLAVAIFSKSDPRKVAWRFSYPIWQVPEDLIYRVVSPLTAVIFNRKVYSLWQGNGNEVLSVLHPILEQIIFDERKASSLIKIKKVDHNPILSPDRSHDWESQAVFNPAAIYDDEEKKVHFLYRAVGDNWVSTFGYAASNDGVTIHEKHDFPAYVPRAGFEGANVIADPNSPFTSGPGTGGCEDPRLTQIGNKVYLTYVAYNGVTGPRVAMSAISYSDFSNHDWNWSDPVLISKPGIIDKNACIFPETIDGKYVIMHRVFPHILIDYVDNLDFDGTQFLKGEYKIAPRPIGWDSRKIGAGPPPIKTPYGWLLIYHAVDDKQGNKYQIGAMLLDIRDPTKVLYRSSQPIISPTHWYENEGHKSGVVYPCGAVVIDDLLHIYYGGADTYICAATAPLTEFMNNLMVDESTKMERIYIS